MLQVKHSRLKIISIEINNIDYKELQTIIDSGLKSNEKLLITGANVHISNLAKNDSEFNSCLQKFQIIHPDGIGIYLASRFLFGDNGLKKRISGSDFYNHLIDFCILKNVSLFFFGDEEITLNRIHFNLPNLNIAGYQNGYNFENDEILKKMNYSNADILVVGLGSGLQEKWISENKSKIDAKVIIAVGDGIKVFAGTKRRGPKLIQKIGLEWFIRFLYEPKRLWKRYFIGIPLFIFRVIKFKFMNT